MMKALFLSAVLMASASAFADKHGDKGKGKAKSMSSHSSSEFFHQADAGKSEVTPSLTFVSREMDFKLAAAGNNDQSGQILRAEYEQGLNDQWSVGGALSFSMLENDDGTDTADEGGLNNLEAFAKGTQAAGEGHLKYGATLSLSPGDREIEANGDENSYTGGHQLTPYVGYELGKDNCLYGAKLSIDLAFGDRSRDNNGTDEDEKGSDETIISLFYENMWKENMHFGVALDWIMTSDLERTPGGKAEAFSPIQVLRFYLPTHIGAGELLPELGYAFSTDDKTAGQEVDSFSQLNLSIGYRISL